MRAPLEQRLPTYEVLKQPEMSFRLDMQMPGVLDHLVLRTVPRIRPKLGEVEIAVAAAGLNFKDMMVAMGVIAGEALELGYAGGFALGLDCAGTIVAVGEGVTHLQIGDEVMALGRNCFSPYVTTDARLVVRKPANISFEESATIPITFLTAYYALHIHGRIRKGERVLIHGADDGVGLAAIQIVQQAGGEVFATAGSPEKRAYLRTLGVQHVLDSHSLAFADEIMRITNGEGVDIVLNSLAGEAIEKSLHVLRSFGRFLEIGKRDMLEKKKLELLPFQHCLSYSAIDSDQLAYRDKQLVQEVMCELKRSLECGIYHPLPYRLFLLSQVVDAFQYLQQSRHIGKIVISIQQQPAFVQHVPQKQALTLRTDASYLITGGVSGFGLATAQWMVKQGARALILVNRSGKVSPEAAQIIEEMRAVGTQVLVAGADVTQEQQIEWLLEQIQTTLPPLRGVVHAAMVMEDSSILNLTEASMKRVIAPKMLGAWNLHVQTRALALDFFVLYSSISAEMGNPGQGNYAAANMFLNALSFYRQAQGLPALTVEWGALAKVGYVAQHGETESHLARRGVHTLSPEQALDALGQLLQESRPLVTVAKIDWKQVNAILLAPIAQARLTRLLLPEEEEQGEKGASLTEETTLDPQQLLQVHLRQALTKILNVSSGDIDLQSTSRLQLDSLMVMELRNSIKQNIGLDLPVLPLASASSFSELSAFVSKQWTASSMSDVP
jgi:polyketide synthase 12/myxalamid-type polyketide synthase MxaB/epothilone polyketide synthase D